MKQTVKEYIETKLKTETKSDEQLINEYFSTFKRITWSISAITKKGMSIARILKDMHQKWEVIEVNRIERGMSAEIFYRKV